MSAVVVFNFKTSAHFFSSILTIDLINLHNGSFWRFPIGKRHAHYQSPESVLPILLQRPTHAQVATPPSLKVKFHKCALLFDVLKKPNRPSLSWLLIPSRPWPTWVLGVKHWVLLLRYVVAFFPKLRMLCITDNPLACFSFLLCSCKPLIKWCLF